jgi:triacylglycerol lipase
VRTTTTWKDLLEPGSAPSFFDLHPLPKFDPSAKGYAPANAWWLAELSRLIYRHDIEEDSAPPVPPRSSFLAKVGLRQVAFFNSGRIGTQAYLVQSDQPFPFAVLVFRGTEQRVEDFLTDLDAFREPLGGDSVRVHEGFLRALDSVWQNMATELASISAPVFYTGHSLGGALATIAGSRLPRPRAIYTFGSPRVGNGAFAAALRDVAVYRVVDDSDAVTKLPPEELGFRHAGELHHIRPSAFGGLRWNPLGWFRHPPKPFADHAPINYVDRIL